ncbi:hypothetical protein AX16_002588 [Volvariella volvacea WC 439]|nr:hypothetical protein AX16_002588 [Volvariella volvacea WC 439]
MELAPKHQFTGSEYDINDARSSRRNTLAPISHLPAELIGNVCASYQAAFPPSQRSRCLIPITHISRHIRSAVIDYPSLWTNINLNAPKEWNIECLRRSREMPLYIVAQFEGETTNAVEGWLEVLKGQESRFKSVDLVGPGNKLDTLWFKSTPRLKRLVVRCSSGTYTPDLFSGVFTEPLEAVRFVELDRCKFLWWNLRQFNLTHLAVSSAPDSFRVIPATVLYALECMFKLKTLKLEGVLFPDGLPYNSLIGLSEVYLPNLTFLSIKGDGIIAVSRLLSHIHYPSSAKSIIRCNYAVRTSQSDAFLSLASRISNQKIQSLVLSQEDSLEVNLGSSGSPVNLAELLQLAHKLAIGGLERLEIRGDIHSVQISELARIFYRCSHLSTLVIHGDVYELFTQMLRENLPACFHPVSKQATKGIHSCGHCVSFNHSSLAKLSQIEFDGCIFDFTSTFKSYLSFKQKIGRQLSCLELRMRKKLRKDVISKYRSRVKVVEWGGYVESDDEGDDDEDDSEGYEEEDEDNY